MKKLFVAALAVALCSATSAFAGDVKSGLQVGDYPGAFNVTDVTGPSAGEKLCYRCQYGNRPVVSIFTRKIDDNVVKLVKEIDGLVQKNSEDKKMAAFVTLLTDDPDQAEGSLKEAAAKHGIKAIPLTVFENTIGPSKYKIAEDAEVTVMMWVESDVKVNHAFGKNELNGDAVAKVVADTSRILE